MSETLTAYEDIFKYFYSKVKDYDFVDLDDDDLEDILTSYLRSSIVRFRSCRKDLSDRDDETKEFNITLADEEIEILANLMIVEWLNPQLQTTELIRQSLSMRDARMYSQAAHIRELMELREKAKQEAQQLMTAYSYAELGDFLDGN